jgi:hypothetical protein
LMAQLQQRLADRRGRRASVAAGERSRRHVPL